MGRKKEKGNGEGTIYKNLKTGRYMAQYFYEGKRKTVYQKKDEKIGDFKKRFNEILSSINTGTYIEKSNETLLNILETHIKQKHNDGITSDRSYKRNLETLKEIQKTCFFATKPIGKITIEDIEKSKSRIREYSKSVIDKIWSMLYKGFKIAYSRRKISYNIMENETLIKPISKKSIIKKESLTILEQKRLESILDNEERNHKYRNVVKAQLISGMRIGEVLARRVSDYSKKNKTLTVNNTLTQDNNYNIILGEHTKTYNKLTGIDTGVRTLILVGELKELNSIINEQLKQSITNIHGLLFWDYDKNTFITPSEINSYLKRLNQKYHITDKSLSSHILRHTRITRWREQGMDMQVIQYLVGHVEGSPLTADVYTSVFDNFIKQELTK